MKCPIQCGSCCDAYWMNVYELEEFAARGDVIQCPHLGPTGCKLPRKKRPRDCVDYLCALAEMALEGGVTKEEIQAVLDACAQDYPEPVLRALREKKKLKGSDE